MWDDGTVWNGASEGKLFLRACRQCGGICHPPLPMCPQCQSLDWDLYEASGQAVLMSWLVSIRPDRSEGATRIVIVAELEEGVAFVSNLVGAALDTLQEGMPLVLCFEERDGTVLPLFRPA